MVKSVIREIVIIILLIIAILLVLGILFYDYNPSTKEIPTAVAEYTLPKELEEELSETFKATETQNIVQTYRVDASDLKIYEKSEDYVKGKPNPFSKATTQNNTGDSNTNSTSGNNTESNSTGGTGIQGSFLNTVK